jgi:hypothetical protein
MSSRKKEASNEINNSNNKTEIEQNQQHCILL